MLALLSGLLAAITAVCNALTAKWVREGKFDEYNWTIARQQEAIATEDEIRRLLALGTIDGTNRASRLRDDYAARSGTVLPAAASAQAQGGSAGNVG